VAVIKDNVLDLAELFNVMNPEDQKEVKDKAFESMAEDLIKLSKMVDDGRLSNTAAKEVFKEMQKGPAWKISRLEAR
jgi:Asp-tRNA(Asn)/Glu-tRNA(Gln) amidotransferase B subunit